MTAKKSSSSKKSESRTKAKQSRASIAKGGSSTARGSADPSGARQEQADADRAQAGTDGNEAAIRRSRNEAGVQKRDAVLRGEDPSSSASSSTGDKETQRASQQLAREFPGQVLGTAGAKSSGATDAATDDRTKRQQIVAEHTAPASHGAFHTNGDVGRGFVDPIPEGARPQGGGSPTLGEHVVGDTEFKGSRGLADLTPGAGKGQKTGAASLAAANLPRGFKPGKSAESEQRDAAYDGNRAAAAAPRSAGQRQASGRSVKVHFVVTDLHQNGPADVNPNSVTAILKPVQGTLSKENTEFFGGVSPSGTIALNAFSTEYDDVFAMGEIYEISIKQRSGSKK